MLAAILVHAAKIANVRGISFYITISAALLIIFVSAKIKKVPNIPNNAIIAISWTVVLISYASAIFAPYVIALTVISASIGVNCKYLLHVLKKTVINKEGI